MLVCALFVFNAGDLDNPVALFVFGALAGMDGLADIVGRRFSVTFSFGGAHKTLIGSLARLSFLNRSQGF